MHLSKTMNDKKFIELELARRFFSVVNEPVHELQSRDPPKPDVSAILLGGRKIALEVTVVHADEHDSNRLRAQEIKTESQKNGGLYAMWGNTRPIEAIAHRLNDKVNKKYDLEQDQELWLLLSSSTPQLGAVVATTLVPMFMSVEDLNKCTHSLLSRSKFHHVYLHMILGGGIYKWSRSTSWELIKKPEKWSHEGFETMQAMRGKGIPTQIFGRYP